MAKGIYKRGNVYWIRYTGLDGKILFESSGSAKFKDAEALLIKRKQAVKEGKQPDIKKIANYSFKELAERYLEWIDGRLRSAYTRTYRVNKMVERFGTLPLRKFNAFVLEQYQTDLMNIGLKPASINRNVTILKHMLRKAVEWNMVEEDVLKRVRVVKHLQANNQRLRFLSKEECKELIKNCSPHLKPIVITALNTGMRKGEILNLKWDQVDLKHGFILLDITKNGERREIPINATLKMTLQGLIRRLDMPYVFYDQNTGKPFKNVKGSFATACRRAKITDFRFHDLRHTFASHLVMSGVDLATVRELLGHKSITMTLRYSHLAPSHKVNAVNILDSSINGNGDYSNLYSIQKLYNLESLKEKRKSKVIDLKSSGVDGSLVGSLDFKSRGRS